MQPHHEIDSAKRFYRPELDVIRFLAFLSVFAAHILPRSGPPILVGIANAFTFGLCLFFVLSAYLITALLLREREATSRIQLGSFYKRRILRIWPLYFGMLIVAILWSLHVHDFSTHWKWYLAAFLMAGNLLPWGGTIASPLWSISVEEQFYLFWPALVARLNRAHLVFAACGMILLSLLTLVVLGTIRADVDMVVWGNTFVQLQMFGAGALLAIFHAERAERSLTPWTRAALLLSVPPAWFVAAYYCSIKNATGILPGPFRLCLGYCLVALSCSLLLLAFFGLSGWPRWIVYLGKISYGLYVFHVPALAVVELSHMHIRHSFHVLPLLLTICLAMLSYRFFETPFLRLKRRLEVVKSRPV